MCTCTNEAYSARRAITRIVAGELLGITLSEQHTGTTKPTIVEAQSIPLPSARWAAGIPAQLAKV